MEKSQIIVTVLITVFFMIILDQVLFGPFFAAIPGIMSSLIGIFFSFRTVLKTEYTNSLRRGALLGILTSTLFVLYVIGIYQTLRYTVLVWAFLSSLIGSLLGFWLGGRKLQTMPPPKVSAPEVSFAQPARKKASNQVKEGITWMILSLIIGAVIGYFAGYIVWIIFGQIQIAMGTAVPYAAIMPPPPIYLIGWTIIGALSFPFKILPELLD